MVILSQTFLMESQSQMVLHDADDDDVDDDGDDDDDDDDDDDGGPHHRHLSADQLLGRLA